MTEGENRPETPTDAKGVGSQLMRVLAWAFAASFLWRVRLLERSWRRLFGSGVVK